MAVRAIIGLLTILLLVQVAACGDGEQQAARNAADDPPRDEAVPAPEPRAGRTFVFACRDLEFTVRVEEGRAWLFLPGRTLDLPQIEAASGARFSDGATTFWNKGQEATLDHDGQVYPACRNRPEKAVWEDAKLRGVDFRAVGNEPGWHLEIDHERMVFVTDYGQKQIIASTPEPASVQDPPHSIWRARADGGELIVKVEAEPCRDSMADASYASTVTVTWRDRTYHGCGRALH